MRGHYRILLGMAAGVGKTYRMLQEGQAEAETGRDVVIGYLEPHGRADTVAQARGPVAGIELDDVRAHGGAVRGKCRLGSELEQAFRTATDPLAEAAQLVRNDDCRDPPHRPLG